MFSLKKLAVGASIGIGVVYIAWAALMYTFQDALLFHPSGTSRAQLDRIADRVGVSTFEVTTEDGVRLYGWHRRGNGERALVYFHGNGGSIQAVPWLAQQLPGIDVIGFSYRGYPGSDGVPSEAGMVHDARAVWAYVTDTLGFRPEHVVLQGQSMGGGVVHHLLMEAEPAGAVFDSTFSSIEEIAQARQPWLPISLLLRHPFRSYERAPKVRVPTLVFHGTDDSLIPVWHGRRIAELQPHSTYVEIPAHGHNAWTLDRTEAQGPWRAFLAARFGIDIPGAPE